MSEIIALSAVGLGFMLLVGIAFAFVVYLVVSRLFRKPAPPPQQQAVQQAPPPYFQPFAQAAASPPPSLLDGFSTYIKDRNAENERLRLRDALDKIAGLVGSGPVAPPNA